MFILFWTIMLTSAIASNSEEVDRLSSSVRLPQQTLKDVPSYLDGVSKITPQSTSFRQKTKKRVDHLINKTSYYFHKISDYFSFVRRQQTILSFPSSVPILDEERLRRHAYSRSSEQFREEYIEKNQAEDYFGLLSGRPLRIQQLRQEGKERGWDNFVPTGVSIRLAAADFLNKAIPPFQPKVDKKVEKKVVQNIGDLLTIRSAEVRAATKVEREIILTGTAHEVLDLCAQESKDLKAKFSFKFWQNYFTKQHRELAKNKVIAQTINTRAVAATLIVMNVYCNYDEDEHKYELDTISQKAEMKEETCRNLFEEVLVLNQ